MPKEIFQGGYMAKNYYYILGVSINASDIEIRTAYRQLVKKFHPDRYGSNSKPFLEIQEAYDVLNDPNKKYTYDQSLKPMSQKPLFQDVTEETITRRNVEPLEPEQNYRRNTFTLHSFQYHVFAKKFLYQNLEKFVV